MNKQKEILFLSFELSGYFMACIKFLVSNYDFKVHIIRYPINPEAPFKFDNIEKIEFYERTNLNPKLFISLIKRINPSLIICSGWKDKQYLKICRKFYSKIPTTLIFDNRWNGTVKQKVLSLFAPLYFKKIFRYAWVPGEEHIIFAHKLGFKNNQIFTGMYSADFDLFHKEYVKYKEKKRTKFPHRFLYVGRYLELKGVKELWKAFVDWKSVNDNDWELWCIGTGELESQMPKHKDLKNFGFVQPTDISKYIGECGVFVLTSRKDNWGVVVHEFAAAGFPLICNNISAAAKFFLKEDYNGYYNKANNVESIIHTFNKVAQSSDDDLYIMGQRSAETAKKITPDVWSNTIIKMSK